MTLAQFVQLHVETGRVFRLLARTCGAGHARRAVGDWERWCPAAVAGLRTKGRG